MYDRNVTIVLELVESISTNYNEFEELLFDLFVSYLPNENIHKTEWKLYTFRCFLVDRECAVERPVTRAGVGQHATTTVRTGIRTEPEPTSWTSLRSAWVPPLVGAPAAGLGLLMFSML